RRRHTPRGRALDHRRQGPRSGVPGRAGGDGVMKLWGLLVLAAAPLAGQSSLGEAADQARRAWLAHDAAALAPHSPSLVLPVPGADPSSPLGRAPAAVGAPR